MDNITCKCGKEYSSNTLKNYFGKKKNPITFECFCGSAIKVGRSCAGGFTVIKQSPPSNVHRSLQEWRHDRLMKDMEKGLNTFDSDILTADYFFRQIKDRE
jgi:hypothetical protein